MKSVRYAEGDLFCVPLAGGRCVLGLISRVAPGGKILLAYVFRELLQTVPQEASVPAPASVLLVARVGDLGLMEARWPIVKRTGPWDRKRWPIPPFGRVEPIGSRAWRVEYRDDNPNSRPKETLVTAAEAEALPPDTLYGHIALELSLSKMLGIARRQVAKNDATALGAFHLVRCPSAVSARDVALLARGRGLRAEVLEDDDAWTVRVEERATRPKEIAATEEALRDIVAASGCEYTGFERSV